MCPFVFSSTAICWVLQTYPTNPLLYPDKLRVMLNLSGSQICVTSDFKYFVALLPPSISTSRDWQTPNEEKPLAEKSDGHWTPIPLRCGFCCPDGVRVGNQPCPTLTPSFHHRPCFGVFFGGGGELLRKAWIPISRSTSSVMFSWPRHNVPREEAGCQASLL